MSAPFPRRNATTSRWSLAPAIISDVQPSLFLMFTSAPPSTRVFDKNLLFNEKSIREKKYIVKKKNLAQGRETRETPEENGTIQVGTLKIEGDKGKRTGGPFRLGNFTYKYVLLIRV